MMPLKPKLTQFALNSLYYTGGYRLLERQWSGVGVIFTLHHVRNAEARPDFSPNRILEISPEFLDQTIRQVRAANRDIVTLDEARRRLVEGDFSRQFVCFTLDDGYLDNYTTALPVFARHETPFTVYVTTGLPDATCIMWWRHLEEIILAENNISLRLPGRDFSFTTRSTGQKYRAFEAIYWFIRGMPHEQEQKAIQTLIDQYGMDSAALCRQWSMPWDVIRELAENPLATIGTHTVNHHALKKLPAEEVRNEAESSRRLIHDKVGYDPLHFTYPYGDPSSAAGREFDIIRDLGYLTGTTTRKGVVFPEHANHLHALPRVSLNGDYQTKRYVQLFLSGAPFAIRQRFERLDVE